MRSTHRAGTVVPRGVGGHSDHRGRRDGARGGRSRTEAEEGGAPTRPRQQKIRRILAAYEQVRTHTEMEM